MDASDEGERGCPPGCLLGVIMPRLVLVLRAALVVCAQAGSVWTLPGAVETHCAVYGSPIEGPRQSTQGAGAHSPGTASRCCGVEAPHGGALDEFKHTVCQCDWQRDRGGGEGGTRV